MYVQLLETDNALPAVAEVLIQLRPQYNLQSLVEQIKLQQKQGYRIAYVSSGDTVLVDTVLCVAGFVVGEKLAWGKHIYIDDLVTNEQHRSQGAGAVLINWLKSWGKQQGCTQLHLDSGVQRFAAHRFYLNNGFDIASHHFSIAAL